MATVLSFAGFATALPHLGHTTAVFSNSALQLGQIFVATGAGWFDRIAGTAGSSVESI